MIHKCTKNFQVLFIDVSFIHHSKLQFVKHAKYTPKAFDQHNMCILNITVSLENDIMQYYNYLNKFRNAQNIF